LEEDGMLSIRDCLDYCDLTDEEVSLIAEHEDIPDCAAAQLCCGLVQTPEGVMALTHCMRDLIERANARGDVHKARVAESVCARFMKDHPLPH
jgi:hypothetical protein